MTCSVLGCDKQMTARGWCHKHYMRWRTHGDPLYLARAENGEPIRWIESHVTCIDEGCLTWPFGRAGKGYAGPVWINGIATLACRIMCELAHGPPPSAHHEVAHSCGKGANACINPKHIRWATPAENAADKDLHGTKVIGINSPMAKLDNEKVRTIRRMKASQQSIADSFGVSRNAVRQVLSGKTWGHVR